MRLFAVKKNKKGVALTYAVMMLLLLSTIIVAITALASTNYTSAVNSVSNDQAFYYAKSIGLAVKQQFLDGYNIEKVITALNDEIADGTIDPVIEGKYSIEDEKQQGLVNGSVTIRYARNQNGYYGLHAGFLGSGSGVNDPRFFNPSGYCPYVYADGTEYLPCYLDVRVACLYQGALSVVTAIFSCEEEAVKDTSDAVMDALDYYDVILTDKTGQDFSFAKGDADVAKGTNVYLYPGDDNQTAVLEIPIAVFNGNLTTSGSANVKGSNPVLSIAGIGCEIRGSVTCYGDFTMQRLSITKGDLHSEGMVTMNDRTGIKNSIYARGNVSIQSAGVWADDTGTFYPLYGNSDGCFTAGEYHMPSNLDAIACAKNVYSQGSITVFPRNVVNGSLFARKDVTVCGFYNVGNLGIYSNSPGGTVIKGDIYADGNVLITNGTYVSGSITAMGDIVLNSGTVVAGNVTSLKGSVTVANASVVGKSVWAKKNIVVGNDAGVDALLQTWYGGLGSSGIELPGIGIFDATSEHHCGQFVSYDSQYTMAVKGNLYVHGEDPNLGLNTNFGAVWIYGGVHLENTRATFVKAFQYNKWGNPSTIIFELYQRKDLWSGSTASPWLDLYKASLGKIVCQNGSSYYDAFIQNGSLTAYTAGAAIHARCIGINNMDVGYGYGVNAKQWFQTAGYAGGGNTNTNPPTSTSWYTSYLSKTNDPSLGEADWYKTYIVADTLYSNGTWTGALTPGWTVFRGANTINVTGVYCNYEEGENSPCNTYLGGSIAYGVVMADTVGILVGEATPNNASAFTIFGGNFILAKINASVGSFALSGNSTLSKAFGEDAPNNMYAVINANVSNSFVLWKTPNVAYQSPLSGTTEPPIGRSTLQIKGNTVFYGRAYNVYHYSGSFAMLDGSSIANYFWSDGDGVIGLRGTFGTVELHNPNSTFTPTSGVTINGDLKLAGSYNNSSMYLVKVNGNMRVGSQRTIGDEGQMYFSNITGNLTVIGSEEGIPLKIGSYKPPKANTQTVNIGGQLYVQNIALTLSAGATVNSVYGASGATVSISGATVTAGCGAAGTVLFYGGTLSGNIKAKKLDVRGGTLSGAGYKIDVETFVQRNGTVKQYDIYVTGGDPSGARAFIAEKGTGLGLNVYITKGGAKITGENALSYSGVKIVAKTASSIAGEFKGGISTDGNLTIGSDSDGSSYQVGTGITINKEEVNVDNYYVFYAGGTLTWKGKATGLTSAPSRAAAIPITSKGNLTMGSASNTIQGYFGDIASLNGSVTAYVQNVESVNAKTTATVYATGMCGAKSYYGDYGIKSGGAATIGGGGSFCGNYLIGGALTVANQIGAYARIQCSDISGLNKIKTEKSAETSNYGLPISLYLTGYKNRTYTLTSSLVKDKATNANTGSITVDPGNLSFSNSVKVEGEIWVDGIFTYNGSTENLVSLGGIRCANTKVNVAKEFKGSIDLPNVTSITLNAKVSGKLYAPNVTSVTLNYDVENVASFPKVTSLTIASGRKVGGIVIKSTGTVTNNGTITGVKDKNGNITSGGVECGYYTGSGTIQGGSGVNLIINGSDTVTISGTTQCNIWSNAPLKFNAVTVGASGTYVYSKKKIEANGTKFNSGMAYILSSGGDTDFTNCTSLPSVQNSSGRIMFKNDSSHEGTIKEVISSGTYISFGTSGSDNYQTVTGNVDWYGSRSGDWGIDGWKTGNQANTVINGYLNAYGTGNVWFGYILGGNLALMNTGTASLAVGTIGGKLLVNSSSSKPVTSLTWSSANVTGQAILYGTKDGNLTSVTSNGTVGGDLFIYGFSSFTVAGKVSGQLVAQNCTTVTSDAELNSVRMQLNGGTFISNKKCSGNVISYNSHLQINADVGGKVSLTSNIYGYWCELGTMSKTITVGGDIKVRGVLDDNSHNKGKIYVLGYYYGDIMKEWNESKEFMYETEGQGVCYISSPNKDPKTYPNACKMNAEMTVRGWLLMFNYNSSRKMHFYKEIYCNALTVNTNAFGHMGGLGVIVENDAIVPVGVDSAFGRKSSSLRDNVGDGGPMSLNETSTDKNLMYFHKPVYVKNDDENTYLGVCHAANCNFAAGSTLITDGQVCLTNCYLTSKGFSASDGQHCFTYGNTVSNYVDSDNYVQQDGSLFAHRYNDSTGYNVLRATTTESNVSVYYGYTYLIEGTCLKGVNIESSSNGTGVNGSTFSKMFYFGQGLELVGTSSARSRIYSNPPKYDHTTPQARTIIWVPSGSVVVGENCYIGKWVTKSQMMSESTEYLPAKELSSNPGVFVTAGTAWVSGTCTLDICAYDGIVVDTKGVVSGKDYQSSGTRYFAGFYLTAGCIYVRKTDGNWYTSDSNNASDLAGFFGYFKCKKNGRNFWAANTNDGPTDRSAYSPDGSKYASMLASNVNSKTTEVKNSDYYTPNSSCITNYVTPSMDATVLKELKKNNFTPYSIPNPFPTRLSVSSDPAKPSVTGEEDASGGQMEKLSVPFTVTPWGKGTFSFGGTSFSQKTVGAPGNGLAFNAIFGVDMAGGIPSKTSQSTSASSITHPSAMWEEKNSSNVKPIDHFDVSRTEYWQPRLIPYVWDLPNGRQLDIAAIDCKSGDGDRLKWGNEGTKVEKDGYYYYLTEKAWANSDLQNYIKNNMVSKRGGNENSYDNTAYDIIRRDTQTSEWGNKRTRKVTEIMVFESGVLPYKLFYAEMTNGNEQTDSHPEKVIGETWQQKGWTEGHGSESAYNVMWYFFACENPMDPYGSAPKDLHVVVPQGLRIEWSRDGDNTFQVIGKGRVFLYLTSGVSFHFFAKENVHDCTFGTLREVNGKLQPQLYIIGVGSYIDLDIESFHIYAYIYMPFGNSTKIYGSGGTLAKRQVFDDNALSSGEDTNKYAWYKNCKGKQATVLNRNQFTMYANDKESNTTHYYFLGKILADKVIQTSTTNYRFAWDNIAAPDLSKSKIYGKSKKLSNGKGYTFGVGSDLSIASLFRTPPDFSYADYDWKLVNFRVDH